MPTQATTRLYSMADADLKQAADALTSTIKRDLASFATRNIDLTVLKDFSQLITNFDNTSTDEEMLGTSMVATEQKDTVAEALRRAIRSVRNMAEMAYGTKGNYVIFGFENMANLSDNDLYQQGKRVVRVATRLMDDLAKQGLTAEVLTAISNLCIELDNAIDHSALQVENRDIETQDRVTKGNALYAEMMRLASVGKSLYEDTDEARYNDYVMVGSKPAAANSGDAKAAE
jgi:hypothetical protein